MINKVLLFGSLLALSSASAVAAPIAFTVTATAQQTSWGYVEGQSYTFVYTTGSNFTNTGRDNQFTLNSNYWSQELVGDDQMWSALGGTGLTGTYADLRGPDADTPFSYLWASAQFGPPYLEFYASNDFNLPIGVQTPDGSRSLALVQATLEFSTNIFSYPNTYTDPTVYFANLAGTYAVTGDVFLSERTSFPFNGLTLTANSLSIAVIPEPSAYGALFGVFALWVGLARRRIRGS